MFVLPATHSSSTSADHRARSRSRPRRETPSPNLNSPNSSSSSTQPAAAPSVPRVPSSTTSASKTDTHGQGAVLPPVPLKVEHSKNSSPVTSSATGRRRRSSSVANADIGQAKGGIVGAVGTFTSSSQITVTEPRSPEKKGHARRSSWQRRLSIGGSASLSATSLDRLDGVQRRSSVSSPKSPRKHSAPSEAEKSVVSLPPADSISVLPRKTHGIGSTSTIASTTGTPSSPAITTPLTQASSASPSDYFGPRTTSLRSPPGKVRPRRTSESRSPRKEEPQEGKERKRLQKRNTSQDTTRSKASQETVRQRNFSSETVREPGGEKDPEKKQSKEKREKDKKTMLSRALQKAHTAVLLDNAQNFEGAIQAYADACHLLQQVLTKSSAEEDRRKLDAIRNTYENRILDLQQLSPDSQINGNRKSLPARPMSDSLSDQSPQLIFEAADDASEEEEPIVIETAIAARIAPDGPPSPKLETESKNKSPPLPISLTPSADIETESEPAPNGGLFLRLQSDETSPEVEERFLALESPMDASYIPPPLSPRRMPSNESQQPGTSNATTVAPNIPPPQLPPAEPQQQDSSGHQSISWLDTIDESARNSISSATSSVHSLADNGMFMRKHFREFSSATEAEFDAALDAAVEAAYGDELEPLDFNSEKQMPRRSLDPVAAALANVALAKNRVKEVEREEAILAAHRRNLALRTQKESASTAQLPGINGMTNSFLEEDLDAEDEERILDEMTKEYLVDGFDFGLGGQDKESKQVMPPQPARQSDSSSYSGRTWNTSTSSSRTTGGTSLSAVAEGGETTSPTLKTVNGLPPLDEEGRPSTASESSSVTARVLSSGGQRDSLRLRRLSGQNAKQLKIETSIPPATNQPATAGPRLQQATLKVDPPPRSASSMRDDLQILPSSVFKPPGSTLPQPAPQSYFPLSGSPMPSVSPGGDSVRTSSPATPGVVPVATGADGTLLSGSPGGMKIPPRPQVRKNKSSVSLKQRNMSISSPESPDAVSIGTPLSASFSNTSRKNFPLQASVQPPTPGLPTFNFAPTGMASNGENLTLPSGGMALFESADLHSPYSPGSPNPMAQNAPIPIEPCPEAYLLRPFWLMRCVYQTIAHPRGGYLSTRLFVPRDVWRVKGVKIKNVEEKISNCDLLTAALGKLASVDTFDADAVLTEMQELETILDQCQVNLSKKLGSDVGVQGVNSLFKDAPSSMSDATSPSDNAGGGSTRTASGTTTGGKSYLSSWRKLRSKGSSVNLPTTGSASLSKEKGEAAGWIMQSVPMTSLPNIRFAKRDLRSLEQGLEGPNRAYMGAVGRLCDAVQVIDQIARQVEDPGLKHSSPTHVGLELCTRHASEFFGFFVCRFVLSDMGMLMDKFIKRGSEWVLI